MKRVTILGSPGSGKTTFARELGLKTGLPVTYLDSHFHDNKQNFKKDRPSWLEHVRHITESDEWIIEGVYKSTFKDRFRRSDTLIFLDLPRYVSIYRLLKRHLTSKNSNKRTEMPDGWREKFDFKLYLNVWRFKNGGRKLILDEIKSSKTKQARVIVLNTPKDVGNFLAD